MKPFGWPVVDWQAVMRFRLGWAGIAAGVLTYQALAGYPDAVAAWIVLGGLAIAALGWYMHGRARMALWRFMTATSDDRHNNNNRTTIREGRNGTEIR